MSKHWDVETARKLYEEGKTDPQIAEIVGVTAQTIKMWRKKAGLGSNFGPATTRKPKTPAETVPEEPEAVDAPEDASGPERTEPDTGGPERTEEDTLPDGPVELHLELCGGWARLRALSWEQAARLWRILDVCIEALGTDTTRRERNDSHVS